VKQYFVEAEGLYQSAATTSRSSATEQILNLDPYNIAARKFRKGQQGDRRLRHCQLR